MSESKLFTRLVPAARWFGNRAWIARSQTLPQMVGYSDEAIVARILSTKDPSAFTALVTRYRDKLTALVMTTLSRSTIESEADDIVQDAFVAAYDNLKSFRTEATFRPWLYKIALNRCLDRLRVARRLVSPVDDFDFYVDDSPGPLETTVRNDQVRRITDAILLLPSHLKVIFLLRHMEDLSYTDLSKVTGLPEGTVKTHLFRARARVRELVKEDFSHEL